MHSVARDPKFEVIVVFEYYDDPERGLARYPSGEGSSILISWRVEIPVLSRV
jgi:hypothetical protein